MDLFLKPDMLHFIIVLCLVLLFAIVEIVALTSLGLGFSNLVDLMVDTDSFSHLAISNWLLVRGLPLSIAIILLLCSYGLTGFFLEICLFNAGVSLPFWAIVCISAVAAWASMMFFGRILAPIYGTETTSVSENSFIGLKTRQISPRISRGKPGEVRITDEHGQVHMVMVEPLDDNAEYLQGDQLELVSRIGRSSFSVRRV